MTRIKALFFDVGCTVFDWKSSAQKQITALAKQEGIPVDADGFAVDWRASMFEIHSEVRQGNLPWMSSDDMHLLALEKMVPRFPLLETIDKEALVLSTWHHLQVFNGAAAAIERLRSQYTTLVLTILNMKSIVNSSKQGGVIWDGIISCELLGYYKPSLQAYQKAIRLMGLEPHETCMVAAHMGDLAAAKGAGMHTVLVKVPQEDHVGAGFSEPGNFKADYEADGFPSLCNYFKV